MEGVNQDYLNELKENVRNRIEGVDLYQFKGSVSKLLGLTVEVKLPGLKIGDLCYIEAANGERKPAEVVAFKGDDELVGDTAKRQAVTNVDNTIASIKRKMGTKEKVSANGKKYTPEEISAKVLMKLKRNA